MQKKNKNKKTKQKKKTSGQLIAYSRNEIFKSSETFRTLYCFVVSMLLERDIPNRVENLKLQIEIFTLELNEQTQTIHNQTKNKFVDKNLYEIFAVLAPYNLGLLAKP